MNKMRKWSIILIVSFALFGCENLTKEDVIGVYYNENLDCEIIINDSIYIYKVNGAIVNQNVYRLSDNSNEIIFMRWLDAGNFEICGGYDKGIICIVPVDRYNLTFSEDERYKNFKKVVNSEATR